MASPLTDPNKFFSNGAEESVRPSRYELWRERLARPRSVPTFDSLTGRIQAFSPGDRLIWYALLGLLALASLSSLYALEQRLLVTVPAYGGTLVEGEVGSPRFINPLLGISDADRDLAALTYAGLMGPSGDGTLALVLAESYSISPDHKVYTFTIRKDAKFSDGSQVTAADIIFTVRKAQDPGLKSPEYADWAGVAVEAVNERTVRFVLSRPYAPFLSLTTLGILPARLWQNISDEEFPFSNLQTQPVGAGPFAIESISRDPSGLIGSVLLKANPRYVLGRPYLDSIRFNFYPRTEDLVTARASGAIESAYDISSNSGASQVLSAPYARVFAVFFNPSEKPVFARPEVREALSHALDRESIITGVLGGYATPIMGPVPPGAGIAQVPVPQAANPTSAGAQVLKKAGWIYDGDARIWKQSGGKLVLDGITIRTSNVPELKNVASAVKGEWEKLGIPVTIELYEPGDLSQNVIRPRKYQALLYGMVVGRDQDLYAFWASQERNDPGLNIALYANKTVDGLLEDARENADAVARIKDLQKIEDLIAADYPAAFIYAPNFTYTVPADLAGIALPQIVTPKDRFATVASWYRATDAVWPFLAPNR
ncbi:peptide ABC transporter substrate-binding protein [Candidatus Kaiserbacteria bacterium]|nr:peptide ABC transporter substrate-binding protein [Candidatus Kaiserbacteria bacterium]